MDRMLVVVFDSESKAYEGQKALLQLDGEGSINVYAYAVLAKKADGTTTVKQGDDLGPIGTLMGTSFGSLIGLLGGPAGVVVGTAAGMERRDHQMARAQSTVEERSRRSSRSRRQRGVLHLSGTHRVVAVRRAR